MEAQDYQENVMHNPQRLASSAPAKQPTPGPDKGKHDPVQKKHPNDEKPDSKPDQENPRKPEKTGK